MWEIWPPGVIVVPVAFAVFMMGVHTILNRRYRRRAAEAADLARVVAERQPKKTSASA